MCITIQKIKTAIFIQQMQGKGIHMMVDKTQKSRNENNLNLELVFGSL